MNRITNMAVILTTVVHFSCNSPQSQKTTDNYQQPENLPPNALETDRPIFMDEAVVLKTRNEILNAHTNGNIYKLTVNQHSREDNYVVFFCSYYNGYSSDMAYYFSDDDMCYNFKARIFNTTRETTDLSYFNTHFKIDGKGWIDETKLYPGVFPIEDSNIYWNTRWDIKTGTAKNGDPYVSFDVVPFIPKEVEKRAKGKMEIIKLYNKVSAKKKQG